MKIIYCLNSIRYLGGIQKVTIVKANALAELPNYEVYIAVSDNKEGILTEPLSEKVHLIDLNINYYSDDWKSKWNVLKGIILKRQEHKRRLTKLLKKVNPDIVISVGQSEKNIIPRIKGNWKTIREFHFDKKYRTRQAKSTFDKVLGRIGDFLDYFILKKYDKIVLLTESDRKENWKGFNNTIVIPNPLTIKPKGISSGLNNTIISVGRLDLQKNYTSLIRVFNSVVKKHPDWTLEIWGEGSERKVLEKQIQLLGLNDKVFLKGISNQIPQKLERSSIFAVSSIFEGFSLVIIEAMSVGIPVVSYACPYGPSDIITDGKNGFLIDVNDEAKMADRICQLIEDEELRRRMGKAALKRAEEFSLNNIISKWTILFCNLSH